MIFRGVPFLCEALQFLRGIERYFMTGIRILPCGLQMGVSENKGYLILGPL